ncbi:tetratricopeptide repeat protein [Streptomyces sp. TLI_171]|uniref:tetratricopeptide repeat protein n=1 Tax=Streptomyces sp. TLI_171 TaxID=1938859 RepID=UPI000C1A4567|nr:tetratricopeptide repeat protein [Streptomyces sp. TLI_171]RKE16843.1 tetratricopeptide repeat protein [Streptomyces sp. TLI_171]
MEPELVGLASTAGAAVSRAAGTDAWGGVCSRVAALLSPGDAGGSARAATFTRLERTADRTRTAGADAEQVRREAAAAWQARFEDVLDDTADDRRPEVAAALRDLVAFTDRALSARGGADPAPPRPAPRPAGRGPVGAPPPSEGHHPAGVHAEGDVANSATHGSVAANQINGPVTINNHPPKPEPEPASKPVSKPLRVRVGTVPRQATAFQPRQDVREEIDRAREGHGTVVLTQVLSGGGGFGKSQLAAAYAHQADAASVDVRVWVDAAETSGIVAAFAEAATKVGAAHAGGADQGGGDPGGADAEADATAFLEWLAVTDRTWLVVLDDVTDIEGAEPWWPQPAAGGNGRVLVTTRRRDALVSGAGLAFVDVGLYTADEARAYLGERLTAARRTHLLDERAGELVEALGRLPLALSHAAAYLINEDVACGEYLAKFTDRESRLDSVLPQAVDTDRYGRQVTASLLLALDAVRRRDPDGIAVPVLRLAALLDPAGHPLELWSTDALTDHLTTHRTPPSPDRSAVEPPPVTPDRARAALRLLHHYALLTSDRRDGHRAVRVHALTARAARETTPPADVPATVRAAADALVAARPEHSRATADLGAVLRANTDALGGHAGDLLWRPEPHLVRYWAGHSLVEAGLYTVAADYWRSLAAEAGRVLGEQHPATLTARNNLAVSLARAGDTGAAVEVQERVVAASARVLGERDRETVRARVNLAASYWQAARTAEAIEIEEWVVADRERVLGRRHPLTLQARHNLAASYDRAGRCAEAVDLREEVLADLGGVVGDRDPLTLAVLEGLATSYQQLGRTEEAVELVNRVLVERERTLGRDHPDTLRAWHNLAHCYLQAGRTAETIEIEERVVADSERLLGSGHVGTVTPRVSLAQAYLRAGRTAEAIEVQERVVSDRERVLGAQHVDTMTARNNLAVFHQEAGHAEEAVGLLERVVADRERVLGEHHPETLASCRNLAESYLGTGRTEQAVDVRQRLLAGRARALGDQHADTRTARIDLATAYLAAGRADEAIALVEGASTDREHRLDARASLAVAYLQAGRPVEAASLLEGVTADCARVLGRDHPFTRSTATALAAIRDQSLGRSDGTD